MKDFLMYKKSIALIIAIVFCNPICAGLGDHENTDKEFKAYEHKLNVLNEQAKQILNTQDSTIDHSPFTSAKICLALAITGVVIAAGGCATEKAGAGLGGVVIAAGCGIFAFGSSYHERNKSRESTAKYTHVIEAIEKHKLSHN